MLIDEGRLIYAIGAVYLIDCVDILILDYSADGLVATAINAGNQTDYDDGDAGGFISAIDNGYSIDCAGIQLSDNALDQLIAEDAVNSMGFADTNISVYVVDELMILIT